MTHDTESTNYLFKELVNITGAKFDKSNVKLENNTIYYELYVHGFGNQILTRIEEFNSTINVDIKFRKATTYSDSLLKLLIKEQENRKADENQSTISNY